MRNNNLSNDVNTRLIEIAESNFGQNLDGRITYSTDGLVLNEGNINGYLIQINCVDSVSYICVNTDFTYLTFRF